MINKTNFENYFDTKAPQTDVFLIHPTKSFIFNNFNFAPFQYSHFLILTNRFC